jgi:hypothetical protein
MSRMVTMVCKGTINFTLAFVTETQVDPGY